jgi:hypothetical protein
MPPESLQYILDCLNVKPYTNDAAWKVTGYLHYLTNQIHIFLQLFDIMNREYQADWLESIIEFQLIELEDNGYTIYFNVPEGTEKFWVAKFKEYEFVEWATLNPIIHVGL